MKSQNKLLLLKVLLLVCGLSIYSDQRAADKSSNRWKIVFFREYMDEYAKLDKPDHKGISQVLKKSFEKSEPLIPKQDKELADGVRDQVMYFRSLRDPNAIAREVKKCEDGMKKARSIWAKMASDGLKARKFVNRFYSEYSKRRKSNKK